ncbi:hypothetical protein ACROYT_G015383 [Oculina patagonica]
MKEQQKKEERKMKVQIEVERDAFSQLHEVNALEDESQWASGSYMHILDEFASRTVDATPQELSECLLSMQEILRTLQEGIKELKQELSCLRADFAGIKRDGDGAKRTSGTPNQTPPSSTTCRTLTSETAVQSSLEGLSPASQNKCRKTLTGTKECHLAALKLVPLYFTEDELATEELDRVRLDLMRRILFDNYPLEVNENADAVWVQITQKI